MSKACGEERILEKYKNENLCNLYIIINKFQIIYGDHDMWVDVLDL